MHVKLHHETSDLAPPQRPAHPSDSSRQEMSQVMHLEVPLKALVPVFALESFSSVVAIVRVRVESIGTGIRGTGEAIQGIWLICP